MKIKPPEIPAVKVLGLGRNRREVAQIFVFGAIGDEFQVFGIAQVGTDGKRISWNVYARTEQEYEENWQR